MIAQHTFYLSESLGHEAAHTRHDLKNNGKMKHDVHRRSAHNVSATETDGDGAGVEVLGDGQNIVLKGSF